MRPVSLTSSDSTPALSRTLLGEIQVFEMAPTRTPTVDPAMVELQASRFNKDYVDWWKMMQRANSMRIKVLHALETDGSRITSDLLGERPRYGQATRCL